MVRMERREPAREPVGRERRERQPMAKARPCFSARGLVRAPAVGSAELDFVRAATEAVAGDERERPAVNPRRGLVLPSLGHLADTAGGAAFLCPGGGAHGAAWGAAA